MKEKQQTRDELLSDVAILKGANNEWLEADKRIRTEFAKAFRWYKQPRPYSGGYNEPPEPILPSWEQVWVNLGTLLAARNFMDLEGNVSELEVGLQELREKIRKEIHPNL